MFIGMLDSEGRPIRPAVLDRVPSESVTWAVEYKAPNRLSIINLNFLEMRVHENIVVPITKVSLFREIDDEHSFVPVQDLSSPVAKSSILKGDTIGMGPRCLELTLSFRENEPELTSVLENLDNSRDEALRHLQFIQKIAFHATGDLRALARNYLKTLESAR